jgi:hypothetical protein
MAKAEDDILRDAIIGTEREIAASAFDREEDPPSDGDRSLESMGTGLEGQHEPEDEDEADKEPDADEPDDGTDDDAHPKDEPENPDAVEAKDKPSEPDKEPDKTEPQGRVPAGRLREEAERARAAIAERDTLKAERDAERAANVRAVAELNAKLEGVLAAMQKAQQPTAPPAEKPKDPELFEDPVAYANSIKWDVKSEIAAFKREMRDREVNASLEAARTRHGQVFEDAFGALKGLDFRNPDNAALLKRMEAAPNPGETVVSWHKRNQAIRTVGDDIAAYNARIAKETREALAADPEFRKELIASLRGDAETGDNGRPRTAVRLPGSLARAPGSNSRTPNDLEIYDGSESAIAASAWSD